VREWLDYLRGSLDRHLAREYGIDAESSEAFEPWRASHQPFHWFVEFYGIMNSGGFDVIIGNPPYLERSKLGGQYVPKGFRTISCKDIYAWVVERTYSLRIRSSRLGLIIPVSIASSASFAPLRGVVNQAPSMAWLAHFANRPGQLFEGAQNRLTIFLMVDTAGESACFSTRYHRWDSRGNERDALFALIEYAALGPLMGAFHGFLPKVGRPAAASFLKKIHRTSTLGSLLEASSKFPLFWVRVPGYFCQFFLRPPMARPEKGGHPRVRGEVKDLFLDSEKVQRAVHAILNSSTYYSFFCAYTDCRHINSSDVVQFPIDITEFRDQTQALLVALSKQLEESMG